VFQDIMQKESRREIVAFIVLAATAFLAICLATHDPRDTLGGNARLRNACGPLGAFVSFQLITWFGQIAAYGITAVLGFAGLALLFRRTIPEWGWKALGAALLIITLACFDVAWKHGNASPSTLPGGYYGQFFYGYLLGELSTAGTYLLLAAALLVAVIISTDRVFYPAFARTGEVVLDAERWQAAANGLRKATAAIPLPHVSISLPRFRWEAATPKPRRKLRARPESTLDEEDDDDEVAEFEPRRSKRSSDSADSDASAAGSKRERESDRGRGTAGAPGTKRASSSDGGDAGEATDPQARKRAKAQAADAEMDAESEMDGEAGADDEEVTAEGASRGKRAAAQGPAPSEEARPETPRPPLKIREPEVRQASPKKRMEPRAKSGPYKLPPLELLELAPQTSNPLDRSMLEQTAAKIEETLRHFKIEARVVEVQKGPTITQYEVSLAAGIKVHKIINLSDDLAMALKAPSIRIVAPIPGKSTVGVEVPNKSRAMVGLRELIESVEFRDEDFKLPLALGRDVAGSPVIGDLGDMPHLLIAGSTGSGKSVCINSIIINLLLTRTPDEVKLILVDPKMVELAQFENIPHLLAPVVTDMKKAPAVLNWTVDKMEERYELLALTGVRHIAAYNALGRERLRERLVGKVDESEMDDYPDHLPFIVVIIDELADLMMTSSKEVEASITRLSQKSRAVGIHVILATQRPSVDVITGLIKANMPSRVSFHVASKVDSRTILDRNGAEKLLGKGDLLYLPPGTSALQRVQGTFISDKEIRDVVKFAVQQAEPEFSPELTRFGVESAGGGSEEDELYEQAVRIVLGTQRGSVTLLQRQLQIGYTRASRLMEIMHEHGLVGPFKGSKAREVYYTLEEWEAAHGSRPSNNETENDPEADEDSGGGPGEGEPGEPGVSEEPR